jgi:hypothetical protein
MGLVLAYFFLSNSFTDLQSWSVRRLPRPVDG